MDHLSKVKVGIIILLGIFYVWVFSLCFHPKVSQYYRDFYMTRRVHFSYGLLHRFQNPPQENVIYDLTAEFDGVIGTTAYTQDKTFVQELVFRRPNTQKMNLVLDLTGYNPLDAKKLVAYLNGYVLGVWEIKTQGVYAKIIIPVTQEQMMNKEFVHIFLEMADVMPSTEHFFQATSFQLVPVRE